MTARERKLLVALAAVAGAALVFLGASAVGARSADNDKRIKGNAARISQLLGQLGQQRSDGAEAAKEIRRLESLRAMRDAVRRTAKPATDLDVFGFAQAVKTAMAAGGLQTSQLRVDAVAKRIAAQGRASPAAMLTFAATLDRFPFPVQCWGASFEIDRADPARSAFSVSLGYGGK